MSATKSTLSQPYTEQIGHVSAEISEIFRGSPHCAPQAAAEQTLQESLRVIEDHLACPRQVRKEFLRLASVHAYVFCQAVAAESMDCLDMMKNHLAFLQMQTVVFVFFFFCSCVCIRSCVNLLGAHVVNACLCSPCLLTQNKYAGCTGHFSMSFDRELRHASVLALDGLFSTRLLLAATGVPIFHVAGIRSPILFFLAKNAAFGSIISESVRMASRV